MRSLYLRAATEAELIQALSFARSNDLWIEATEEFALDVIGVLHTPGFHANLILINENLEVPESIIINPPVTPDREWL